MLMRVSYEKLFQAQLTGACTNPARALPPAVLAKDWTNLWVGFCIYVTFKMWIVTYNL